MKYTHVVMNHVGGPDVLHMQEGDVAEPKTGEVRIEILATDVSFSKSRNNSLPLFATLINIAFS